MIEGVWIWLAWRLPRPLAYWAAVRVGAETLPHDRHPDDHTWLAALRRWSGD